MSERDIGAHTVCRNPHQPVFADARLYIPVSPCVDRCVPITDRRSGVLQVVIQPLLELSVRTQSLGEHRPVVRTPLPQMRFEREAPGQHVIHVGADDFHHVAMLRYDEPAIAVCRRSAEPFAWMGVTRRISLAVMFDLPAAIKQNPEVVVLLAWC